ncbi:YybH family protein [Pseudarthrobacter sp. IC2-21]|jgi:ketosteroid isomerase-like protein|uniref:YybH family protein n=1 Tax=Pseudarthrobacter sp. IC2-21 TaxID=3092262 RepID=UPI002A6B8680|nr:nuclear transport factor 2 family protein [Pseudarthrobacter sp. IC2-21]
MTDKESTISSLVARHELAASAIHRGDPGPLIGLLSEDGPTTLFPAVAPGKSGWADVSATFRWVSTRFADGTPVVYELVAADVSGDLAYTVGYERSAVSVDGGPLEEELVRVTHIYRRENGEWRLAHRHGDTGQHVSPGLTSLLSQAMPDKPRPGSGGRT